MLLVGSYWHHLMEEQEVVCCHFGCCNGDMVPTGSDGIHFPHSCVSRIHDHHAWYFHLVQWGCTSSTVTCSCMSMFLFISNSHEASNVTFFTLEKTTLYWKISQVEKTENSSHYNLFGFWLERRKVGWLCFS